MFAGEFTEVVRITVPTSSGSVSSGSGFILDMRKYTHQDDPAVYIVTNAHVVDGAETIVKVNTVFDPRPMNATVLSVCYDADMAVVELNHIDREACKVRYGPDIFKPLQLAKSPQRPGAKLLCVGHPLGIPRQTEARGQLITYMRTKDARTIDTMVPLTDVVCNPGCSGGPALLEATREVVGINSFKLRTDTIDGMSGLRPAHQIAQLGFALMAPKREVNFSDEKREQISFLRRLIGRSALNVSQHIWATSDIQELSTSFNDFAKKSDKSYTFRKFLRNHVVDVSTNTMRCGGASVLHRMMTEPLADVKGKDTWNAVRECASASEQATMPVFPSGPPHLVHVPIFGALTHGIHNVDLLMHYNEDTKFDGGALVTQVLANSMYAKADGQAGDIIHSIDGNVVGVDGKIVDVSTHTRIDPVDFIHQMASRSKPKIVVTASDGKEYTRSLDIRVPTYDELPKIHAVHPSREYVYDAREQVNLGGVVITTMRLNHAVACNHVEFLKPGRRYEFHAVVAHISPTSVAFGHPGISTGAVITHINEEPVPTTSWSDFASAMESAMESGHLRLTTSLGMTTGVFSTFTE